MKIEIKTKTWVLILLMAGLFSCTKQEIMPVKSGGIPETNPSVPEEPFPVADSKEVMPLRITGNNLSLKLSYTGEQYLRSVVNGEDSTVISYNSKFLARDISFYQKGQLLTQTIISLNAAGLPGVLEQFKVEKNSSTFVSSSTLVYDAQLRLKEMIKTNPQKLKIAEMQFVYLENNSVEIHCSPDNQLLVYAQLQGEPLFKNVKNAWLFALEGFPPFFFSSAVNLSGIQAANAVQVDYLYHPSGFPQSMEWKTGNQTGKWLITYMEIPH